MVSVKLVHASFHFAIRLRKSWSRIPHLLRLMLGLTVLIGNAVHADEGCITQGLSEYSTAMEASDRDLRLQAFARAEQLFNQAVDEQFEATGAVSTELLVNQGNAALQSEHIGPAIVAYRRALLQQPNHQRARQNLQFARGLLPESMRIDPTTQLVDTLFFWKSLMSRAGLTLLASCCFFLAASSLAVGYVVGLNWLRLIAVGLGLVWSVLMVSVWWDPNDPNHEGVVVVDDAYLYSADSVNSQLRLNDPLPDGTEVSIVESRDRWLEIEVVGRTGWIHASAIERLGR